MATAKDWLEIAEENAKSGEHLLGRERYRASASRFYYAAYQAAHAVLFTTPLRGSVPARGNWDHGPLANALKDGAMRHLSFDEPAAEVLRKKLASAMHARVVADYWAGTAMDERDLFAAEKAAVQLIALAFRHGAMGT
jgi:hypothetical protein